MVDTKDDENAPNSSNNNNNSNGNAIRSTSVTGGAASTAATAAVAAAASTSTSSSDDAANGDLLTATSSSHASAFRLLEQYFEADMLSLDQMQFHKEKYTKLNNYVLDTYRHEKNLLKQAKQLNQELLNEKILVEKQAIRKAEELASFTSVEKDKEKALKELAECIDRDAVLSFEITELQREHVELLARKDDIVQAHAKLIEPEVRKLSDEIAKLSEENHRIDTEIAKESQRKKELLVRMEFLQQNNVELATQVAQEHKVLTGIRKDPERMTKQAEVVQRAVDNMKKEVSKFTKRFEELHATLTLQTSKKNEAEEVQKELNHKLDMHRETIEQRQRDVEHVTLHLHEEQTTHVVRLEEKNRLEMAQKHLELQQRHENEINNKTLKEFDFCKRELKKKTLLLDQNKALLPNLRLQVVNAHHQHTALQSENDKLVSLQHEVKTEVDALIARYLQSESHEKTKHFALLEKTQQVTTLETELSQWLSEETKQSKIIHLLSAQREFKAREAANALESEKVTQQELKMKELVILDLAKKCHETNNHLKEFSALYDVVKNERNKYVNLIQASSQALAEMKEKIKILVNEVEVLRNESVAKDRALVKEKLAHQTAQCSRDSLRLDTNKSHELYRIKQEQIEQQIVEIDKLNSIISSTEKDMLRLKKKYEQAVDARNATGVQLIDRNDELCILYEKANLQAKALSQGELSIQSKDQEMRMLQIQLTDLQREVVVARKQMPQLPRLAQQILELQKELDQEREITDLICRDLETPQNASRWRALDGDDPDAEQLQMKLEYLQDRFNRKKEQLLEKELVLEEVTSLSDKLRSQASDRRGETLELAKQVNEFQTRIKEITRRMMAIVSELSMYQATAIKLQQAKHDALVELEQSRSNLDKGLPPTPQSHQELVRHQFQTAKDQEKRHQKLLNNHAAQQAANFPSQLTFTTAEPRPNAYIPPELGIPKPYGVLAPFKPSQTGSTMRHIRVPQKRDIEI